MAAKRIGRIARRVRKSQGGNGADTGTTSATGDAGGDLGGTHGSIIPASSLAPDDGGGTASGDGKRRGGWPKGRKRNRTARADNGDTAKAPRAKAVAAGAFEKVIVKGFDFLARFTAIEGMALPPDEAEELTEAIREFQKHHEVPALSDKRMSEFMLASAVLTICAPRAMLFFAKGKAPEPPAVPIATAGPIAPSEPGAHMTSWFTPDAEPALPN